MQKPNFEKEINAALIESGANPFRAKAVSQFVSQCYELLFRAHQELVQPPKWRKFCRKRGATTSAKSTEKKSTHRIAETAISADLSLEANRLLALPGATVSAYVLKSSIASVQADVTSPSDYATGSSSKRPDLVFLPASLETQLTFAMEAKVIRKEAHVTADLLGESGFGCFVRAVDPYESNGVIGLVGYAESAAANAMSDKTLGAMKNNEQFSQVYAKDFEFAYTSTAHQVRLVLSQVEGAASMVCVAGMLGLELVAAWPILLD